MSKAKTQRQFSYSGINININSYSGFCNVCEGVFGPSKNDIIIILFIQNFPYNCYAKLIYGALRSSNEKFQVNLK
jgi:hypothetical protein